MINDISDNNIRDNKLNQAHLNLFLLHGEASRLSGIMKLSFQNEFS